MGIGISRYECQQIAMKPLIGKEVGVVYEVATGERLPNLCEGRMEARSDRLASDTAHSADRPRSASDAPTFRGEANVDVPNPWKHTLLL